MLVTRRNQDFMPTLFNELLNWNDTTYSTPRMNIMETKDDYKLELCIPGLTKEDVKLSIDAEGNLVYKDTTKKDITVYVKRKETQIGGRTIGFWDVLLGDMRVKETANR